MAIGPYELSVTELDAVAAADRNGDFYLLYRDDTGHLLLHSLDTVEVTIGRTRDNAVCISWDPHVSRSHARLEWENSHWKVVDAGKSRNGTFVGTERVEGSRTLDPGDMVTVGRTTLVLRAP